MRTIGRDRFDMGASMPKFPQLAVETAAEDLERILAQLPYTIETVGMEGTQALLQEKYAKLKSGIRPPPGQTIWMHPTQIKNLPAYNTSDPTGLYPGKRWVQHSPALDLPSQVFEIVGFEDPNEPLVVVRWPIGVWPYAEWKPQ